MPSRLLAQSKTHMSGTSLDKPGCDGAYDNSKSFIGHAVLAAPRDIAGGQSPIPDRRKWAGIKTRPGDSR
jgi:hypothetical protein